MGEFKGWKEITEGQYEADLGELGKVYAGRTPGSKWAASAFDWTRGHLDSADDAKLAAVRMVLEYLDRPMREGAGAHMTQDELEAVREQVEKLRPSARV